MSKMKNLAAAGAIGWGLVLGSVGIGAGVAAAAPPAPLPAGHGHGGDGGHGHGNDWDDWHGGWHGPGVPVPVGCVSATDPSGLVTGSFCV